MTRIGSTLRRYEIERIADLVRLLGAIALVSGAAGSGIALLMMTKFR